MNLYIRRTMIVPAEFAPLARGLAAHLAGPPAEGMWQTELSPTGEAPATHYVSSGVVAEEFGPLLTDAEALWGAIQAAQADGMATPANGPELTLALCEALVDGSTIVDPDEEGPFECFARLELKLVTDPDIEE